MNILLYLGLIAAALKVVATIILLCCNWQFRDQPGLGSVLWWTTKITPAFILVGFYVLAWQAQDRGLEILAVVMTVWVVVMVPRMIRLRQRRIAQG